MQRKHCVFLALSMGFICRVSMLDENSNNSESWTYWYNTDDPLDGSDIETVSSLSKNGYSLCGRATIIEAECRIFQPSLTFRDVNASSGDITIICNQDGLQCYSRGVRMCPNYEVRFKCQVSVNPQTEQNNAFQYFFFLAIIPIAVLLFRIAFPYYLQRKKIRNRQGSAEVATEAALTTAEINSGLNAPPPSYAELFSSASKIFSVTDPKSVYREKCNRCNRYLIRNGSVNNEIVTGLMSENIEQAGNAGGFCVCRTAYSESSHCDVTIGIDNMAFSTVDELSNNTGLTHQSRLQTPVSDLPSIISIHAHPPSYVEALEILRKGRTNSENVLTHL